MKRKGKKTVMKAKSRSEIECSGEIEEMVIKPRSDDPIRSVANGSDSMDHCYVPRVRPDEVNGFSVYTRSKRLKSASGGRVVNLDGVQGVLGVNDEAVISNGEIAVHGGDAVPAGGFEGDSGNLGFIKGELMEIEVKEETRSYTQRRFTRSTLKSCEEDSKVEVMNYEELRSGIVLKVDGLESGELAELGSPKAEKLEMKMSKKIVFKGRPTTVKELFETGLLEGYPVFYNGGKRGFPLRGTIKESGILCSCSLCQGTRVVPLCQFEIHACKSYRRASQYICLENGKSLLDVVKECQKSSVKTLEETIQNFIGPIPVMESVTCRNCEETFSATSAAKMELLCDSCMIIENSEIDAGCVKLRSLEPLLGFPGSENGEVHNTTPKKGRRGRKKMKHLKLTSNRKSPGISPSRISSRGKSQGKITKLSSKIALSKSLESEFPSVSIQSKSSSKITKKDQRMHRLVFQDDGLPDGTEVAYYSNGKKLRDGYKLGSGIICHCCSTLVSPSQFEAHAGWASRRKPYMYIYTSNGVSLHEFAVSLLKGRRCTDKDNDDLCIICADGGKLVLCDGCPRAFHKECASLSSIPRGKWYCTYCQNMFQRESFVQHNANAVAAGRVSGIDPIEQITNRCIRIVKNPEVAEVIACVICRGYDFSKSGFGPRTVILCDQCEKEYHVGCLKKCKMADLKELPKGKWFCTGNCKRIYSALEHFLNVGEEKLPESSLSVIKKKQAEKGLVDDGDFDVRWRLLNGKVTSRETRVLLSQAVAIFHDSFDPIVDSETGRDFIPSMVYGRNIRGQDFSGMYCAILTVNSTVVSAGILRIFGQEIAELPLAATRIGNQGKGYFQVLFSCIENFFTSLKIRNFVLPATDDAKSIWTDKFGFEKMSQEQLLNYRKICWQMITFKGTSMLEKAVPKCQDEADPEVSCNEKQTYKNHFPFEAI